MSRGAASLVLLVQLTLCLPALAGDAADPAAVVKAFYAAYASGDAVEARAQWEPAAVKEFDRNFDHSAAVRCMTLHGLRAKTLQVDGDAARVRIEADLSSWSRYPADRGRVETVAAYVKLARGGGRWQIVSWRAVEVDVAEAVAAGAAWRDVVPAALENGARVRLIVRELTREAVSRMFRNESQGRAALLAAALEVAAEYDDSDALSEAVGARSILESSDRARSEALARESLALAEKLGNPDVVARALQRVGRAEALGGLTPREPYERMVTMADSIESILTVANASVQLAEHYDLTGDYRNALLQSIQSMNYANASGERSTLLSASVGFGWTYFAQGDLEMAVPHFERSIAIARQQHIVTALPFSLRMLAHALWGTNRRDEARASIDEALSVAGADMRLAGPVLLSRATLLLEAKELDCAERDLRAVIAGGREMTPLDLAQAWAALSRLRLAQQRAGEALASARMANQFDELGAVGHFEAAAALRRLGRLEEAAAELRIEAERVDDDRARAVVDMRQLRLFAEARAGVYADLADVLVDLGRVKEAAAVVARSRGRALHDLRRMAGRTLTPAQQRVRGRLEQRVEELNALRLRAGDGRGSQLHDELARARLELDDFLARSAAGGHAAATEPAMPAPSVELRGVTVVEYVAVRERLLAFVRVPGARLRVVTIAVDPPALRTAVDRFVAAIERRDLRFPRGARALYELLVAPLEPLIRGSRMVCIIPDGDLWRLPFHALRARDGQYLGDRLSLFYAPSIEFLAREHDRRHERKPLELLAFANATAGDDAAAKIRALYRNAALGSLPDAEIEVKRLARMYGAAKSRLYVGANARESAFKRDGASSRVVHIATHGVLDDQSPMYSALILAAAKGDGEDGLLEAREIASMRLDADLAVLSACETARGHLAPGEGVVGIAWAFLVAGCPTTVVSQWKADSAATAELMVAFHRHLRAGAAPAQALRGAQRELRRNPRYRDPLYWAPFIVLGAGR